MANKKIQNQQNEVKEVKVITEELIAAAKAEGKKVVKGKRGTKLEGFVKIDEEVFKIIEKMPEIENESEEKPKQIHEAKDRDIKIESGKVGDIGVKMIYHREKSGEKQYRIFLAQKVDGKLKRTRYMTEELKANQKDEVFVKKIYEQILAGKVKVQVA